MRTTGSCKALSKAERKRYNAVGREYKKVQGEMKREDAARRASLQQTGLAFGAMALVGVAAMGRVVTAGIAFNRHCRDGHHPVRIVLRFGMPGGRGPRPVPDADSRRPRRFGCRAFWTASQELSRCSGADAVLRCEAR